MIIRFNKQGNVDAVVPTAINLTPQKAPGDVLWQIPTDINPQKTITVSEPVQATDPNTGLPEFDQNGQPVYETTPITNPDGTKGTQTVYQDVQKTYALLDNPSIFTQTDISAVLIQPATIL